MLNENIEEKTRSRVTTSIVRGNDDSVHSLRSMVERC